MGNLNNTQRSSTRHIGTNLPRRRFLSQSVSLAACAWLPTTAFSSTDVIVRPLSEFRLSCAPNPSSDILTPFRVREIVSEALRTSSRPPCLDLRQYRTVSDDVWAELGQVPWVTADIGVENLSPVALDWIRNQFNCFIQFMHLEDVTPAQLQILSQQECAIFRNVRILTPAVIDFVSEQSRWVEDDGTEGAGYFSFSGDFQIGRDFTAAVSRSVASFDFQTRSLDSFLTAENARLFTRHRGERLCFEDPRSRSEVYGFIDADPPDECPFDAEVLSIFRSTTGKRTKICKPVGLEHRWALTFERLDDARISSPV